jgi:CheY-like chemotaxis protein
MPSATSSQRVADMRILIADDDAISRLMLKAMATKLGHECLLATHMLGIP